MPRPTSAHMDDNDIFFANLTDIKNQNLGAVMSGAEIPDGGFESNLPEVETVTMEDFKEEVAINEEIRAEQEENWGKWKANRNMQLAIYALIGFFVFQGVFK